MRRKPVEVERVDRECRDADEHLKQLLGNLERHAQVLGELSGRMDRQKNTAPIDWSGAYEKIMVEAGNSVKRSTSRRVEPSSTWSRSRRYKQ